MEKGLYSIYDRVAEAYGPIFEAVNDGVAIRKFKTGQMDMPQHIRKDYWLFYLGNFEDQDGVLTLVDEKKRIETEIIEEGDR